METDVQQFPDSFQRIREIIGPKVTSSEVHLELYVSNYNKV